MYRFQTDQRNSRYHNEDSDHYAYRGDDNEINEEDAPTHNYWNERVTNKDAYRSKYTYNKKSDRISTITDIRYIHLTIVLALTFSCKVMKPNLNIIT